MARRRPIDERVVRLKSGGYLHEREYMPKRRFVRRGMRSATGRSQFVTVSPPGRPDVRLIVGCLPKDADGWCRSTTVQKSVTDITPQRASALRRSGVRTVRKNKVTVQATRPGITKLPAGAWKTWSTTKLVTHFADLAKRTGAGAVMRAVMNIERWNKNRDPKLSRKAGQVVEGLKRSKTYHKALAANPAEQALVSAWLTNPRKRKSNPQLMVISNPRKRTRSSKAPSVDSHTGKLAQKAYKRFHFTGPAKNTTGWVPDGWPKAYITIGSCLRLDVKGANGKKVVRNFSGSSAPRVCTTSGMKDVYVFGNLKGIPSGIALRVDYRVPSNSKRRKWASDWTHDHDSKPRLTAHSSGKAIKISGKKLKVTPRGIEG